MLPRLVALAKQALRAFVLADILLNPLAAERTASDGGVARQADYVSILKKRKCIRMQKLASFDWLRECLSTAAGCDAIRVPNALPDDQARRRGSLLAVRLNRHARLTAARG